MQQGLCISFFCLYLPTLLLSEYLTIDRSSKDVYTRAKFAGKEDLKYSEHRKLTQSSMPWSVLQHKLETARINTGTHSSYSNFLSAGTDVKLNKDKLKATDNTPDPLDPFQPAKPFTLDTLDGPVKFPSALLPNNSNTPIIFHTFNNHSGFLECLWTDIESLGSLVIDSTDNVRYVFMSTSEDGYADAVWMRGQVKSVMADLMTAQKIKSSKASDLLSRMFFVTTSVYELGNWIPSLLCDWACEDHGCGLSQAKFTNTSSPTSQPLIMKRLDAMYDWLPSPGGVFGDKSTKVVLSDDGCSKDPNVTGAIAVISDWNCGFYDKVNFMEQSHAIGVIIYASAGQPVQVMNCVEQLGECNQMPPSIPATMIPYSYELIKMLQGGSINVTFQTTPTSNFYFAIDGQGLLAEMGWLLFPSFQFFVWQAEWFNYKSTLQANLNVKALVLPVVDDSIMQGETGIVTKVKLPKITEIQKYKKVELDASLSCPGTRDGTCPPWDHIMSLYVCCDNSSMLCGKELGRWITPFRRRIGRWLTDITPLVPLLSTDTCTFTMKLDAFWAQPWRPSLNIRFTEYSKKPSPKDVYPYKILPLFEGGTFNKSYNSHYKPINFQLPSNVAKVDIVAIITGHGSDENGCGEFCPTSHHFVVNDVHENMRNFSTAGTALGCAEGTPITGVEPNEHGTWLYGRNGWCNGREVDPWVIDITSQVSNAASNHVTYYGWYQGGDPDPKSEPGYIVMYSYLVFYRNYT